MVCIYIHMHAFVRCFCLAAGRSCATLTSCTGAAHEIIGNEIERYTLANGNAFFRNFFLGFFFYCSQGLIVICARRSVERGVVDRCGVPEIRVKLESFLSIFFFSAGSSGLEG